MNFLTDKRLAASPVQNSPARTGSVRGAQSVNAYHFFSKVLSAVAREGLRLPDPVDDPGGALRVLYDRWVEMGGYERGKPKKGVRQIREWLGPKGNIRSLETKLSGRTCFKRDDVKLLFSVLFMYWNYNEEKKEYEAFDVDNIDELIENLLSELFSGRDQSIKMPLRTKRSFEATTSTQPSGSVEMRISTEPSREVIEQLFIESDALVTISRERALIETDPAATMAGFRRSIQRLYEFDRADNRQRALIWIVDVGGRSNNASAYNAFYNLESLAMKFRTVAIIEDEPSKVKYWRDIWAWLIERGVVIVGSLRRSEIDHCYSKFDVPTLSAKLDLSTFVGANLFLEATPPRWLEKVELAHAFGRREGELWRRPTITAHLSLNNWNELDHDEEVDSRNDLRYLLHSSLAPNSSGVTVDEPRCIEIGQPGWRWSDGFRLACTAAFGRLDWNKASGRIEDWREAAAQLRRHNFAVLRIVEFCRLIDMIANIPRNEEDGQPDRATDPRI